MRLVVFLIALGWLVPAAHAEGRFALVIAVSDYDQLRDLQNPGNDAMAIGAELEDLGFDVTLEINRDARRMRRALEDFAEDAEGAEIALVYYAGHGVEIGGQNHLLPADADASSPEALAASAIALSEVAATLVAIAPAAILLVDACRDDPFSGTALAEAGRSAIAIEGSSEDHVISPAYGRIGRADGLLYAFSTAPGAVALDGGGENSPYAEALLRHLGRAGLSLPTILTMVAQDVYDRSDNRQLPYFESALSDLVFVSAPPPDLSERDALLLSMAGLTPELRGEVERIATLNEVPLAPLYAALLAADLASLTLTEREAQLTEAASEYRAFIAQVATLGQDDPRIVALRDEAAELMRLGAYGEAQAKYEDALALGAARAAAATDALVEETLSLVETLKASALAAQATLDHATGAARYRQIADELGKVEALGLPEAAMLERTNALWRLGDTLSLMGDVAAAEDAFEEMNGVAVARADADPMNTLWQSDLSLSWNKIGDIRRVQGDLAGAEVAYFELLLTAQALSARDPLNSNWQRDLSISWNKIGNIRVAQGDLSGAEVAYADALKISRVLAASDPQNNEWQRDVWVSWGKIGDIRVRQGDLARAEAAFVDALTIARSLVALDPQNIEWQRDLSINLDWIGESLLAMGDLGGAEAAYVEALSIAQALTEHDPMNTEWQRNLSVSWESIGEISKSLGDLAGAEAANYNALRIRQALTARDPLNTEWKRDLYVSLSKIGDIRSAQGDLAGAGATLADALTIVRALAASDPMNAEWQRDLSLSLNRIGDLHLAQTDLAGAELAYSDALKIGEALIARDPSNAEWQNDLSVCLDRIGNVHLLRGDLGGAQVAFVDALRISRSLAERDPQNIDWQRSLSVSLDRVGDLRRLQGDLSGAEAAHEEAFKIRQALVEVRLGSIEAQLDLVVSYIKLSLVRAEPRPLLEDALAILQQLQTEGRLPPANEDWIDLVKTVLAAE